MKRFDFFKDFTKWFPGSKLKLSLAPIASYFVELYAMTFSRGYVVAKNYKSSKYYPK